MFTYRLLCERKFLFLLSEYLGVGLLDPIIQPLSVFNITFLKIVFYL